jgi:hypothetical protein
MRTWKLLSGMIAAVAIMAICVTGVQAQSGATVTLDGTVGLANIIQPLTDLGNDTLTNVAADESIVVAVWLNGVTTLTGYSIALEYDPTYIERIEIASGLEYMTEIGDVLNITQMNAPLNPLTQAVTKIGDSFNSNALSADLAGSAAVTSGYASVKYGNTYLPILTDTAKMPTGNGLTVIFVFKTKTAFVSNTTSTINVSLLEWASNNGSIIDEDEALSTGLTLSAPEGPATPVLGAIADTTIEEGTAIEIQAMATDGNADTLTYSVSGADSTMTISDAGLIAWTPTIADSGANTISVIATDPGMLADTVSFVITVTFVPPTAPVLEAIADVSVLADAIVSVQAVAADVNKADTVLVYSLDTGAPAAATISATGLIEWTTAEADTGANSISVIAADAGGLTDTATFVVTVAVPNVPEITAPSVAEDTVAVIAITEVNPDASADTLVAVNVTAGGATVGLAVSQIDAGDDLTAATFSVTNEGADLSTAVTSDPILAAAIDSGGTDAITATNLLGYFNINLSGVTQGEQLRVTITLSYDPASFTGNEMDLQAGRFNTTSLNWERHETIAIDTVANTITVVTKDFSVWAIADTNDAMFAADPAITPVEMIALDASVDANNAVTLNWSTASETNNFGFYIERSVDTHVWTEIGFVEGHGTTEDLHNYTFVDNAAEAGTHYVYRMRQVDYNGDTEISNSVAVVVAVPSEYALRQNYPNPFNPTTNISFDLKETGRVKLELYNVLGQKVMTLIDSEVMDAGMHVRQFGMSSLATGVYFYKLEVNNFSQVKKMMLLK